MSKQLVTPLSIQVQITVLKPVADVFAAVQTPKPFFVETASGPLEEGKTVQWKFPEFDMQIPVKVIKVVPNQLIRMEWGSAMGGQNTCEFKFSKPSDLNPSARYKGDATTVSITESGWPDDKKGWESANGNTFGWSHFACALKAHLEHGVNLRTGAFLHRKF